MWQHFTAVIERMKKLANNIFQQSHLFLTTLVGALLILSLFSCDKKPAKEKELSIADTSEIVAPQTDQPSKQITAEEFFQILPSIIPSYLDKCAKDPKHADSLALVAFDSLTSIGEDFFDLYYLDSALIAKHETDSSAPEIDTILWSNGMATGMSDGYRMFKGDPKFIGEKFKDYLSDAGKAFFETRAKDQLQSALYDDGVVFLPADTVGERLFRWDEYVRAFGNTYLGSVAKAFLRRYLVVFLPEETGWNKEYLPIDNTEFSRGRARYIELHGRTSSAGVISEVIGRIQKEQCVDSFVNAKQLPVSFTDSPSEKAKYSFIWFNDERFSAEEGSCSEYTSTTFYNYDLLVDMSGQWLSLRILATDEWELVNATPKIIKCNKQLETEDISDGTFNAVCISLQDTLSRYLFFSKILDTGKVDAAFKGVYPELPGIGERVAIYLNHRICLLVSDTSANKNSECIFLSKNGSKSFLLKPFRGSDAYSKLEWLGDLDRDGRLDAILTRDTGCCGTKKVVLLSRNELYEKLLSLISEKPAFL